MPLVSHIYQHQADKSCNILPQYTMLTYLTAFNFFLLQMLFFLADEEPPSGNVE